MVSDYRCFFCIARAFERLIDKEDLTRQDKELLTRQFIGGYQKMGQDFSAPLLSREMHHALKQCTKNGDPYKAIKRQSNDMVLSMYPDLKRRVIESENPFEMALRLSVAGNIIDYAVGDYFDLWATIDQVLTRDIAIDHSLALKSAVQRAGKVLFLGDNAGEIVFDKILIETLMHPQLTYAVRGEPVINDATRDDAVYVGMDHVADLIDNGYDAPSTITEKCSSAFQAAFDQADVIISKGQGNLEGLLHKTDKEVYFLLMVKCEVIADALGVSKGDFVVKRVN